MTIKQQLTQARATIAAIPADYTTIAVAELIAACASGNNEAWMEFIRRYNRIIAVTAARIARRWDEYSPDVVDDLVQDTYLKLCADEARVLGKFRLHQENSIFGFLKVVTANLAIDYFKKRRVDTVPPGEYVEPVARAPGRAELAPLEVKLLLDKVDDHLRVVLPSETRDRDRTIFRLYYGQGLTAKQIAALPVGLTVKGVEAVLHRMIQLLRKFLE